MANELQNVLLNAIDTVINDRVDRLAVDKTITATVDTCVNMLENKYSITYQGGMMYAFAQDGAVYSKGQSVYVLIPENKLTNKKIILGTASKAESESDLSFISSTMNSYNEIGSNVVSTSQMRFGVNSYKKQDYVTIYEYEGENNLVEIDEESFAAYLKSAKAFYIGAEFNTADLPRSHRLTPTGNYGLIVQMTTKDKSDAAATKTLNYVLDTKTMTGNPFQYGKNSTQFEIYPIDDEEYVRIERIIFFCEGFVQNNDSVFDDDNIFMSNLEILALKSIDATNGDYSLYLSTPSGSIFQVSDSDDKKLSARARLTYKGSTITDTAMYYWFKRDGRVSYVDDDYHKYGGSGWSYLNEHKSYLFTTSKSLNMAYENVYKVVCVYQEDVVLSTEFTIYNKSNERDIRITASPGEKFSFDRGTFDLVCSVNNVDNFVGEDDVYEFVWSRVNKDGSIVIYNQTEAEIDQLIADAKNPDINQTIDYTTIAYLNSLKAQVVGVEWNKNRIKHPTKLIKDNATFYCSVYLKVSDGRSYLIGEASIVISNDNAIGANDNYHIVIENGDQVFQYSESGVAPTNERYNEPLEIKPIKCLFYDPNDQLIKENTYSLRWQFNTKDTLIKVPQTGTTVHPIDSSLLWLETEECTIDIKDNYDYSAHNNQVTAIVTYNGVEYTKDTNFTFVKIGDNGTNGTDIVAKITLTDSDNESANEYPYILDIISKDENGNDVHSVIWSSGEPLDARKLTMTLYQRNVPLGEVGVVSWSICGGSNRSKRITVNGDGRISLTDSTSSGLYDNLIVLGRVSYEGSNYYARFPIPYVESYADNHKVVINKADTLKYVVYNADGRNPMYNKNQGVFVNIDNDDGLSFHWLTQGGFIIPENDPICQPENSDLRLIKEKDSADGVLEVTGQKYVYILPNDTYNGAYCNNNVRLEIKNTEDVLFRVFVPICMTLNTYGLASLNQWDGNHIEINEDGNYILAPQIGAGIKDNENKFTGLVMGTASTYDSDESQVGLLGYAHGVQSIFLDAETGGAYFGKPEQAVYDKFGNKIYTEGRIELVPGGTSKIGNWKIGSDFLYNVTQVATNESNEEFDKEGNLTFVYKDLARLNANIKDPVYKYKRSIPHRSSGILLNSLPSYISIKGREITDNSIIDIYDAESLVSKYDSFELELDPNKESLFSIFRHTPSVWYTTGLTMVDVDETTDPEYCKYIQDKRGENPVIYTKKFRESGLWRPVEKFTETKSRESNYIIPHMHYDDDGTEHVIYQRLENNISIDQNGYSETADYRDILHYDRELKVGIRDNGSFYVNALQDARTSSSIGPIGAFGRNAASAEYMGSKLETEGVDGNPEVFYKAFVATPYDNANDDKTLYISGTSDMGSEYIRPISLNGKHIILNAEDGDSDKTNDTAKITTSRLYLNKDYAEFGFFGNKQNYIKLNNSENYNSEINVSSGFNLNTGKSFILVSGNDISANASGNITVATNNTKDIDIHNGEYRLIFKAMDKYWIGSDSNHLCYNNDNQNNTELRSSGMLKLISKKPDNTLNDGIQIVSCKSYEGIILSSQLTDDEPLIDPVDKLAHESRITIKPDTSTTEEITDTSGYIRVEAKGSKLEVADYSTFANTSEIGVECVSAAPGFATPYIFVDNYFKNVEDENGEPEKWEYTTTDGKSFSAKPSIIAAKDIVSLNGWVKANKVVTDNDGIQVGDKIMADGWFDEIQRLYDSWDKTGNFPQYNQPVDLSGYLQKNSYPNSNHYNNWVSSAATINENPATYILLLAQAIDNITAYL